MMTLLERIAQSNGDPQRTIAALRLINKRLAAQPGQSLSNSRNLPRGVSLFEAIAWRKASVRRCKVNSET